MTVLLSLYILLTTSCYAAAAVANPGQLSSGPAVPLFVAAVALPLAVHRVRQHSRHER